MRKRDLRNRLDDMIDDLHRERIRHLKEERLMADKLKDAEKRILSLELAVSTVQKLKAIPDPTVFPPPFPPAKIVDGERIINNWWHHATCAAPVVNSVGSHVCDL